MDKTNKSRKEKTKKDRALVAKHLYKGTVQDPRTYAYEMAKRGISLDDGEPCNLIND